MVPMKNILDFLLNKTEPTCNNNKKKTAMAVILTTYDGTWYTEYMRLPNSFHQELQSRP